MPTKLARRRRGRAAHVESDDDEEEIVRAATSDSEGSNDSSADSDDSDEDESDEEPVSRHLTPNTSHSPAADEDKPAPFFAATPTAWADIVDDAEAALPVIAFGELDAHAVRQVRMAEPESDDVDVDVDADDDRPVASSSRHSPAPPPRSTFVRSQSARQAYQTRLDSDPSFVPVVGEFWGHDDRLLDKNLRSLSGWWRGRWGRGRGGVFPPRGRGRGGAFATPPVARPADAEPVPESPMDRTWTHDGFEEMRRREETRPRRGQQHPHPVRGSPAFRARALGRPWFTMRPENAWTKQSDGFLFNDPTLKPRLGHPAGLRVRLPGSVDSVVVRAVPRGSRPARANVVVMAHPAEYVVRLPTDKFTSAPPLPPKPTQAEVEVDADADAFTVKLPPPPPKSSLKPDADGWVRPDAATAALAASFSPPLMPVPLASGLNTFSSPPVLSPPPLPNPLPAPGAPAFWAPPPHFGFPSNGQLPIGFTPPPGFPPPPHPFGSHTPAPSLSFSGSVPGFPPSTPSPAPGFPAHHTPPPGFGTPPFGAPQPLPYAALPPGVALDARGMPYEVASGRPVYLQPPPQPQQTWYPGHGHSMSMPMMGMADPSLFSFARPGRVEIRAPGALGKGQAPLSPVSPKDENGDAGDGGRSPVEAKKRLLRTGAAAFVPSHSVAPSLSMVNGDGGESYGSEYGGGAGGYVPTQYFYPAYAQQSQEGYY
ncbi:hypothetical protein FB45DRAFT_905026 [Roridomyces roridus]|uniref:Btz domain-containing protein n=1 Tax=Roridomyces roridus TaxID=1738132 RepID=A0AAD7C5K0_9AGAR|nr:hypothetical protein FB45DRAFT_905026 [Roridomyces roridus]